MPFRPFRLLTVDDAMRIMEDGNLNVRHLSQGKDMATRLAAAVNAAVWNIHRQLTSTGEYTQATAPLQEPPGAPIATGEALSPQTLEAVEWGFAKIPSVFKLAVVGGCCGGKTKSRKHIGAALRENDRRVEVFATPEIATVLFHQGAMSNGSFADFVAEEYKEFMVQSEILQFVFEGIWAQGAALSSPSSSYAVLMTDRDALDGRSYSRPLASWAPIGWSTLLDETGKRISIPDLTESDLEQRYEIGAVFWHSLANTNGKLNALGYERECQKPTRHESAQEAFDNDVNASKVYEDGYPTDRIIWLSSMHYGALAPKLRKPQGLAMPQFLCCDALAWLRAISSIVVTTSGDPTLQDCRLCAGQALCKRPNLLSCKPGAAVGQLGTKGARGRPHDLRRLVCAVLLLASTARGSASGSFASP